MQKKNISKCARSQILLKVKQILICIIPMAAEWVARFILFAFGEIPDVVEEVTRGTCGIEDKDCAANEEVEEQLDDTEDCPEELGEERADDEIEEDPKALPPMKIERLETSSSRSKSAKIIKKRYLTV